MGESCSVKNKRNMEFNPVKEPISLSLYRRGFKNLKELDWGWNRNQRRRDSGNEICLYVRYRGTTAILSISQILIRDTAQPKCTYYAVCGEALEAFYPKNSIMKGGKHPR